MVVPLAAKSLIVLSHSLQARRMRLLLANEAARELARSLANGADIVFLEWGGSEPHSPEWALLQEELNSAPIIRYALPRHPNVLSNVTKKSHVIRYQEIPDSRPQLERIVLFSYHSHYAYLAHMAKARGIELILVEEGLSTLRGLVPQRETRELGRLTQTLHLLYWLARDLVGAFHALTEGLMAMARRQFREIPPFSDGYRAFDPVYSHFPDVVGSIFTGSNIQGLAVPAESGPQQPLDTGVSIFIGQAYELSLAAVDILLTEMLGRTQGQIVVLPHPRASQRVKSMFEKAIARSESDRVMIDDSGYPAEKLIRFLRPQHVFSLTSTVLLEVRLWFPTTETVSLVENILDRRCELRWPVEVKIREDYAVIRAFQSAETVD